MRSTEATVHRDLPALRPGRSVRDRLLEPNRNFSNSEMKAVRVLLANYPAAGLTTVSKLAKQAGVSDPTVLRLAQRLGFEGFAEMQEALLAEVEAHMRSPLTLPAAQAARRKPNAYQAFFAETLSQCEAVVRFASEARARGVHVILFTDQWASPIAGFADVVITTPTATASPFDTLVTPLLQAEAVAVGVAERLGADWRSRAALLEEVRNDHNVTLDSPSGLSKRKRQSKG
jgi:DNA-binding MurR/RpiR family transcriptional regulator